MLRCYLRSFSLIWWKVFVVGLILWLCGAPSVYWLQVYFISSYQMKICKLIQKAWLRLRVLVQAGTKPPTAQSFKQHLVSHQAVHSSTSRVNDAALRAAPAHAPDVTSILRLNTRLRSPILSAFCLQTSRLAYCMTASIYTTLQPNYIAISGWDGACMHNAG